MQNRPAPSATTIIKTEGTEASRTSLPGSGRCKWYGPFTSSRRNSDCGAIRFIGANETSRHLGSEQHC
jgi:hypothetical protein